MAEVIIRPRPLLSADAEEAWRIWNAALTHGAIVREPFADVRIVAVMREAERRAEARLLAALAATDVDVVAAMLWDRVERREHARDRDPDKGPPFLWADLIDPESDGIWARKQIAQHRERAAELIAFFVAAVRGEGGT